MSSGEISTEYIQNLSYQIEYRRHLLGIRFNEADYESRKLTHDSGLVASTENQVEYLKKCSDSDFVKEYYNALCVLDDCVNTGKDSKKDSALRAYKKISRGIDSAIGSVWTGEFVPDSFILDYIKKISGLEATVLLSEITV